ncbi:GTP cyclohydrolase I [Galbitalea sp. SE-J8]|uniref:GTP cyclohydrolase I n=1 Tax=Galbitalea sp. SE-J8 TaxID=3054952 RepID=UPI00259CCF7B|nr:GTP cyclohydrolase I [Galbitalea sp. SE-J8]MDM4761650.1 GTP cyclohydrolase I [Galbitalea sp. SE-J8]
MPIDTARIEAAVADILSAIGEDVARPGLSSTPRRVAEAYADFFSGLDVDPVEPLRDRVELRPDERGELVLVRGLDFRSMCEHHLLPFLGTAHIAYVPRDGAVGLGAIARVLETLASRPQLQERLGEEVAQALETGLGAAGVLVVLEAVHGCVSARGVRQVRSSTVTVASRGTLADPAQRACVLALVGSPAGAPA